MRWLFFFLLVVNLIVFALFWQDRAVRGGAASAAPPSSLSGERLVLLEERDPQLRALSSPSEVVGSEPDPASLISPGSDPEPAPDPEPTSDPEPAGTADLYPVPETDSDPVSESVPDPAHDAAELSPDPDDEMLCSLVGPFSTLLRAEYLQEFLGARDIVARVTSIEVPGDPAYWVYQAPQPSRKAALRRLQELQAKGIDSFVVPKGEFENGISFGYFSLESGALQRMTQVVESGYEATIKKVTRAVAEIWVAMTQAEAAKIDENLWLDVLSHDEGLEMRQFLCSAVAPE